HVIAASYVIEHPLTEPPKFYVKTKKERLPSVFSRMQLDG
ncbi:unnamed protein product, partial [marine sediment metagenome]